MLISTKPFSICLEAVLVGRYGANSGDPVCSDSPGHFNQKSRFPKEQITVGSHLFKTQFRPYHSRRAQRFIRRADRGSVFESLQRRLGNRPLRMKIWRDCPHSGVAAESDPEQICHAFPVSPQASNWRRAHLPLPRPRDEMIGTS